MLTNLMSFCNQTGEMAAFSGVRSGDTGSYPSCLNLWTPSVSGAVALAADAKYCVVLGMASIRPPPLLGVCVPSACNSSEMLSYVSSNSTSDFIRTPFNGSFAAAAIRVFCSDDKIDDSSRRLGIGMMVVLSLILVLVVVSTIYDQLTGLTENLARTKARFSTALMSQRAALNQSTNRSQARHLSNGPISSTSVEANPSGDYYAAYGYRDPEVPSYYRRADNAETDASFAGGSDPAASFPVIKEGRERKTSTRTRKLSKKESGTVVNIGDNESSAKAEKPTTEVSPSSPLVVDRGVYQSGESALTAHPSFSSMNATSYGGLDSRENEKIEGNSHSTPKAPSPAHGPESVPPSPGDDGKRSRFSDILDSITEGIASRKAQYYNSKKHSGMSLADGGNIKNQKKKQRAKHVTIGDGLSEPLFYSDGSGPSGHSSTEFSQEDEEGTINADGPTAVIYRKSRDIPTSQRKIKGKDRRRHTARDQHGHGTTKGKAVFEPLSSRFTEYADTHLIHELVEGDLTRSEKVRTQIALHVEKMIDDIPNINTVFARFTRCWSLTASFRRWRTYEGSMGSSAATEPKEGGRGGSNLRLFNSIRTLCWVWIVFTDTYEFTTQIPTYEGQLRTHINPAYAFLNRKASDTYAIGTFLLLSGFTVIYQLRADEKKANKDRVTIAKKQFASWPSKVRSALSWYFWRLFRRWIRLVPLYLAVVFLSQSTLLAVDAGAFWPAFLQDPALHSNCVKTFFYSNLFFINNLVPVEMSDRCFPWTFYFALDFQFFALAPIFHHTHRHMKRPVFYVLLATLCGATLYGRFAEQDTCTSEERKHDISDSIVPLSADFTTPATMLVPYVFGCILCYFHAATLNKALEIKMFGPQAMSILRYSFEHTASKQDKAVYWLLERLNSKRFRILCIWGGFVIALATVFGSWLVARDYENSCSFNGRVFAALSILPWCFGIFFVFLPMIFGYGGAIQRALTHRLWANSSKLVFAAYLTHPVIISIVNCIKDHPETFEALPFIYEVWGNATFSLLVAFLFHLLIEQPFMYMVADEEM